MTAQIVDAIDSAKHALKKSHSVAKILIEQEETQRDRYRSQLLAEVMLDYIAEAEEWLDTIK